MEEFTDLALAEAHEAMLENKEVIGIRVQSFLNKEGLTGRSRKQKENVAQAVIEFLLTFDDVLIEATVEEPTEVEVEEATEVAVDDTDEVFEDPAPKEKVPAKKAEIEIDDDDEDLFL